MQDLHVKLIAGLSWQKQHSTRRIFSPAKWTWRKKPVQCYIWSIAAYSVETSIFRKVHHKYVKSFEVSSR